MVLLLLRLLLVPCGVPRFLVSGDTPPDTTTHTPSDKRNPPPSCTAPPRTRLHSVVPIIDKRSLAYLAPHYGCHYSALLDSQAINRRVRLDIPSPAPTVDELPLREKLYQLFRPESFKFNFFATKLNIVSEVVWT